MMRTIEFAILAVLTCVSGWLPVDARAETLPAQSATRASTTRPSAAAGSDDKASHPVQRLAQRRRGSRRGGWRTRVRNRPRNDPPAEEEASEAADEGPASTGDEGEEDVRGRVAATESSALAPRAADEPAEGTEASAVAERGEGSTLRRSNRMEFDARLVRGETAGSGAVVLFDRGLRNLPPLTRHRTRFLSTTVREVLGRDGVTPAPRSEAPPDRPRDGAPASTREEEAGENAESSD